MLKPLPHSLNMFLFTDFTQLSAKNADTHFLGFSLSDIRTVGKQKKDAAMASDSAAFPSAVFGSAASFARFALCQQPDRETHI